MRVGGNGAGNGLYGRVCLFGSCSSRCKRGEPLLPFQAVLKILASFLTCGRHVNNVANSFRRYSRDAVLKVLAKYLSCGRHVNNIAD